jgi:hypothetical protein
MRAFFLRIPLIIFALLLSSLACNVSAKDSPSPAPIQPNQETTSPVPDASIALSSAASVTKQVNAVLGGKIELITPAGDQVLLIIPPFALLADTEITLSALASAPQNPIAATFFPGISIQPDQITLRLPATLMVIPSAAPPGLAPMLFFLKHPDLVLPLGQQAREGDALSGKLLHFSTYTGGSPTGDEALSQAEQAASQTGGSENWRGDFENTQAVGEWSGNLESLGLPEDAAQAAAQASEQLKAQIECLFDLNCTIVPLDPCGDYQQQLMQYFKQATLLGFDPEGSLMTQLYAELERVLNECTNRYTLEYNHQLSVNRDGLNQEIQVTGKVLMNAPIYGVFDLGDPLKPQGSGSVDVKITGTMVSDDQTCSIAGSGQHSVEITGELVADEMGEPWMALDVTENWYTSGSMTITCPDGDSQTVPIPNAGSQTYPLRFQYINGAKSMAPNLGGMQGSYNWILHILHSW